MKAVIKEGIKEGGDLLKTLLTGKRAVEIKEDGSIEVSDIPKKLSPVKIFIMALIAFIVYIGGRKLLTEANMATLIAWMQAYSTYVLAITPTFSILILLVGGSGLLKKSKWSKDQ
jgi:hypothetical protein